MENRRDENDNCKTTLDLKESADFVPSLEADIRFVSALNYTTEHRGRSWAV